MSDGVQFAINIPINQDLEDDEELLHEPPKYDAQPAKSVLKKDGNSSKKQSAPITVATDAKVAKKKNNSKKELKWDEQVIEEHDLLRGTRMKIDEPNTPYANYDQSDDEISAVSSRSRDSPPPSSHLVDMNWDHLHTKLGVVAAVRAAYSSSPSASTASGYSDSEPEVERRYRRAKEAEFKQHRKQHYNEVEALKQWRASHQDEEMEDGENANGTH